jgi:hypothetical protein
MLLRSEIFPLAGTLSPAITTEKEILDARYIRVQAFHRSK